MSCPAICDFICTMADASTVPTTRSSVGTDSCVALATETGTMGGPAAPLTCACRSEEHTTGLQSPCNLGCRPLLANRWRTDALPQPSTTAGCGHNRGRPGGKD